MENRILRASVLAFSLLIAVSTTIYCSTAIAKDSVQVIQITPSGDNIPAVNQIVIKFNKKLTPLGNMRRTSEQVPVKIKPILNCQWQWLTPSALACQLDKKDTLKLATKYKITINKGALNDAGESLTKPFFHTIETTLPKVSYSTFSQIKERGKPVYGLHFNQNVSRRSVERTIKFQYKLNGKTRQIAASASKHSQPGNLNARRAYEDKNNERNYWAVHPSKLLPKDTAIELIAKPGLESSQGKLKSREIQSIESFRSFDEFKFIGISCSNTAFKERYFNLDEMDRAKCNPNATVSLEFSSPVDSHQFYQRLELSSDGELSDLLTNAWKDKSWANIYSLRKQRQRYSLRLPSKLLPNEFINIRAIKSLEKRSPITDLLGQPLIGDIQASFKTRDYSPRLQLPQANVVLEKGLNSDAAIIITNLESVYFDYELSDGSREQVKSELDFAKNQIASTPIGIREILNDKSGIVTGVLSSTPATLLRKSNSVIQAQITPYQVHAKMGHYSSLVWVTDLATGELVKDAKVEVIGSNNNHPKFDAPALETQTTDQHGIATLSGLETLDPEGNFINWCGRRPKCKRMFIRVTKGGDSALLPMDHNYEISLGQITDGEAYNYRRKKFGHINAWGTTAQGIYRPGDTIEYKIYVRDQSNKGLAPAPKKSYELRVEDSNGNYVHETEELELNSHGSLSGKIKLPDSAALGWYTFMLSHTSGEEELYPLEVLVTDFTPALFRLSTSLNGATFSPGQELVLDIDAKLHSGGPYPDVASEVEVIAIPSSFQPKTNIAKGFKFDNYDNHYKQELFYETNTLSAQGHASSSFTIPVLEDNLVSAKIIAQSLVEDERGKSVASRSRAEYLAVDRLVGLKSKQWVYQSGKSLTLESIVVDKNGIAIKDTAIDIRIYNNDVSVNERKAEDKSNTSAHPKGWSEVAACSIVSTQEASTCSFTPELGGTYEFIASIDDSQGRPHQASYQIWVSGHNSVYWDQDNPNVLELVSEKSTFNVGETARYLVKNPYPGAKALITIERNGVLESWQQILEGSAPIIEVEIKREYAPGVYLSVLVTKPRTGFEPPKVGKRDENRPDFKIGYQKIDVANDSNSIEFDINTNAEVYKPGDTVTLTLKPKHLKTEKLHDIELAISVLDEAVLDLVKGGSEYFNPQAGFNKLDELDLANYNLLNRLVGLQSFSKPKTEAETKLILESQTEGVIFHAPSIRLGTLSSENVAAFASADGVLEEVVVTAQKRAEQNYDDEPKEVKARDNLVDSAHWQDNIKIGEDGTVTIEFKLPDNLTAWRVLAIAATPSEKMGLSQHSFKVNQLTEIRSVMPNQVTETDNFNAGFSVLNRSDEAREITLSINASGSVAKHDSSFETTLQLAAHARETVFMPMAALQLDDGVDQGSINYRITASDSLDADALKHHLPIYKRKNLTTSAVYGSTTGKTVDEHVLIPNGIASDLGGITVKMSPTIISNVGGAFQYMRYYPHACWEQKLTKAVMASHYKNLGKYLNKEIEWPESKNLIQETLDIAINSQAPNGGMTYFKAENRYVSPYLSAYTALAFTWLGDAGYQVPQQVQEDLHNYLNTAITSKTELANFSSGALSTVRAVALSALAKNGDLSRRNLLNHVDKSREMSLFGKAHLLSALQQFDKTYAQQQVLLDEILAQSNNSAGKIGFNESLDQSYARLHSSPMRSSCAILETLTANHSSLADKDLPSKLVKTIVAKRGGRTHWENTQDNVYCLNALSQYASVYEADQPLFNAKVSLDRELIDAVNFSGFSSPTKKITLPMSENLVGKAKNLAIEHDGVGRLYYQTLLQFSNTEAQSQRENSGLDIRRERSVFRDNEWQLIRIGDQVHRGETIRTDLFLSTPVERNFVAVRDPIPGGLEPVNSDLATNGASLKIDHLNQVAKGSFFHKRSSWQGFSYSPWGFYHKQLGHDAVTFYSDFVAKGEYHLSYLAQAIATGEFFEQPVHAEEMYHPDIYGKGRSSKLLIVE